MTKAKKKVVKKKTRRLSSIVTTSLIEPFSIPGFTNLEPISLTNRDVVSIGSEESDSERKGFIFPFAKDDVSALYISSNDRKMRFIDKLTKQPEIDLKDEQYILVNRKELQQEMNNLRKEIQSYKDSFTRVIRSLDFTINFTTSGRNVDRQITNDLLEFSYQNTSKLKKNLIMLIAPKGFAEHAYVTGEKKDSGAKPLHFSDHISLYRNGTEVTKFVNNSTIHNIGGDVFTLVMRHPLSLIFADTDILSGQSYKYKLVHTIPTGSTTAIQSEFKLITIEIPSE